MLHIGRASHPVPVTANHPVDLSVEFVKVGGWSINGVMALDSVLSLWL